MRCIGNGKVWVKSMCPTFFDDFTIEQENFV